MENWKSLHKFLSSKVGPNVSRIILNRVFDYNTFKEYGKINCKIVKSDKVPAYYLNKIIHKQCINIVDFWCDFYRDYPNFKTIITWIHCMGTLLHNYELNEMASFYERRYNMSALNMIQNYRLNDVVMIHNNKVDFGRYFNRNYNMQLTNNALY